MQISSGDLTGRKEVMLELVVAVGDSFERRARTDQ
jgi:hypothetical protein